MHDRAVGIADRDVDYRDVAEAADIVRLSSGRWIKESVGQHDAGTPGLDQGFDHHRVERRRVGVAVVPAGKLRYRHGPNVDTTTEGCQGFPGYRLANRNRIGVTVRSAPRSRANRDRRRARSANWTRTFHRRSP